MIEENKPKRITIDTLIQALAKADNDRPDETLGHIDLTFGEARALRVELLALVNPSSKGADNAA